MTFSMLSSTSPPASPPLTWAAVLTRFTVTPAADCVDDVVFGGSERLTRCAVARIDKVIARCAGDGVARHIKDVHHPILAVRIARRIGRGHRQGDLGFPLVVERNAVDQFQVIAGSVRYDLKAWIGQRERQTCGIAVAR